MAEFENICIFVCDAKTQKPLFFVPLNLLKKAIDTDFGLRPCYSLPVLPQIWDREPEVVRYKSHRYYLFVVVPNRRAIVDSESECDLFLSIGETWTNYNSWEELEECIIGVAESKVLQQKLF